MSNRETLKIKPYARLLTMLGEQLIKNERIALIELIKNAYDADSKWVKVIFQNFNVNFAATQNSSIIIEDAGHGMTEEIIRKHWLNPATPEKKIRKEYRDLTESGRIIQGEKGIGRFAILKLGRKIKVYTRAIDDNYEQVVDYDFSMYDDDFLEKNGQRDDFFLDSLEVYYNKQKPEKICEGKFILNSKEINRPPYGTRIEISDLKGSWSEKKIKDIHSDISKLSSIFVQNISKDTIVDENSFEVYLFKDEILKNFNDDYQEKLHNLLHYKSVIKIEEGIFDVNKNEFRFKENGIEKTLNIFDPKITGINVFRKRFNDAAQILQERSIECGSFKFGFYIFDFSTYAAPKYSLDRQDKEILKEHRIYLYRDQVRVYPYGEPDDDWLRIDVYRGTISAGAFLSNDQVVGYINISNKDNPKLKDKTNREGLIEEGNATEDFIVLIQTFLAWVRQKPFAQYKQLNETKTNQRAFREEKVSKSFEELKETVSDNSKAKDIVAKVEKEYKAERQYLVQRAETTEELAGVGLSVETASHDIMAIMGRVFTNLDGIIQELMGSGKYEKQRLLKDLQSIRGGIGFIETQLKDIQLIFKSSKQRRKPIRVKEVFTKVEKIYKRLTDKEKMRINVNIIGSPLIAKTTDAVLLQLFLNLMDNSVYWLKQTSQKEKIITITFNGENGTMIFSDNGPGISEDDIPFIFDPFYTGKGEEGRGLGLYIARQLLERQDYTIRYAEIKSEKILSGANFVISFISEEE